MNKRIATLQREIASLRAEKARLADNWVALGWEKTQEAIEALSAQIIHLYEEMDAIESGATRVPVLVVDTTGEEKAAAEIDAARRLGWSVQQVRRPRQ